MARGDVSFTFLDRIGEIRRNVRDERWQSALALALTLPDICGGIAYPELVKKYRDGRVMEDRYGNPARDVGNQYILWFDQYAAPFFKKQETDEAPYICGERCWQLRCEYLHQNKGFVNLEAEQEIHFHLGINCGTSICQLDQETDGEGALNIRLDIEQLCLRLSLAAQRFYEEFHETCDFDLYNTPVIDFIQWSGGQERRGKTAAVVCRDEVMAKGLAVALEPAADRVLTFTNPYDPVKRFAKKKPSVCGMIRSATIALGCSNLTISNASLAFSAVPTTSISCCAFIKALISAAKGALSSTINNLICFAIGFSPNFFFILLQRHALIFPSHSIRIISQAFLKKYRIKPTERFFFAKKCPSCAKKGHFRSFPPLSCPEPPSSEHHTHREQ